MTIEDARQDWLKLISAGVPGQLLLGEGPLRCYYGIDDLGRAVFFVLSQTRSEAPKLADLVHIDHGRRPDGNWTVVLTLTDSEYAEAFAGMCLEVARRASAEPDEASALRVFDSTISDWRRLLSLKTARRLSDHELRGLIAELQFLKTVGLEVGASIALEAWAGPHGAPQDFRFGAGRVFEVKAIRVGATALHISSIEQLEAGVADLLTLVAIDLNDIPSAVPGSFTLPSLVGEIAELLRRVPADVDRLYEKLALLQVDVTDEFYAGKIFELGATRHFLVADGFPRIRTRDIPTGVVRAKYQVLLNALLPFAIEPELHTIGATDAN